MGELSEKARRVYSAMEEKTSRLDDIVEKLESELKYVKECNEKLLARCANQSLKLQILWEKIVSLHEESGSLDDLPEFIILYDQ
jgi:hypothetical protein